MSKPKPKAPDSIRWPAAVVILVLATVGFVIVWQLLLEGRLTHPPPEQVVREFLQLGLPNLDGFEVNEVVVLRELTLPKQAKGSMLRVRFRARDDLGQLTHFDKVFVVVGEQVKSAEDWTPELDAQINSTLEKRQPK